MRTRTLMAIVVAGGVGLLAFIFVQWGPTSRAPTMGVKRAAAKCTETGPECLPRIDLVDIDGTTWTAEELAGRVVMVNFWATWCQPCVEEIPALVAVHRRHADGGLVLLGLMNDPVGDQTLRRFIAQFQMGYPVIRADHEHLDAFGYPSALPTTFFYDRSGHLRQKRLGHMTEAQIEAELAPLLAEPAP
jgi:cytochrome c biogenesis protein CcmG, thiol:disulfide interchange protein DsbE